MELVSDHILWDDGTKVPRSPARLAPPPGFNPANHREHAIGHPDEWYVRLARDAPVTWFAPRAKGASGFWLVSSHALVREVESDPETFSSQRGSMNIALVRRPFLPKRLLSAAIDAFINMDAPHHTAMRLQQRHFFTPVRVEVLRDAVSAEVDRLLDALEVDAASNDGVADFTTSFAAPLPLFTACELLGIDRADRSAVSRWMDHLTRSQEATLEPFTFVKKPGLVLGLLRTVREMFAYGERTMRERRIHPRDDLMSSIATTKVDGEYLRQEYLDGAWLLMIFAGNDTTRNSLSAAMRLLTRFPHERERMIAEPKRIAQALPEILRLASPVIHMRRTAIRDTEIASQPIAENEKVVLNYPAANRDPNVFRNPLRFDPDRPNAKEHLAFGYGPHICLGSRVALLQIEIALTKLLARFPDIHWTGEQTIEPSNFVHTISSLKVRLQ